MRPSRAWVISGSEEVVEVEEGGSRSATAWLEDWGWEGEFSCCLEEGGDVGSGFEDEGLGMVDMSSEAQP